MKNTIPQSSDTIDGKAILHRTVVPYLIPILGYLTFMK